VDFHHLALGRVGLAGGGVLEFRDARRRWRRGSSQQVFEHEEPALDGGGAGGIRGDEQETALRQDATALGVLGEIDGPEFVAGDAVDSVKLGEPLVEKALAC
jgi:hypothetical protein